MKKIRLTETQYKRLDQSLNEGSDKLTKKLFEEIKETFHANISKVEAGDKLYLSFGELDNDFSKINWDEMILVHFIVKEKVDGNVMLQFKYSSDKKNLKTDVTYVMGKDSLIVGRKSGKIRLIEFNEAKDTKQQITFNNFTSITTNKGDEIDEVDNPNRVIEFFSKLFSSGEGKTYIEKPNDKDATKYYKMISNSISKIKFTNIIKRLTDDLNSKGKGPISNENVIEERVKDVVNDEVSKTKKDDNQNVTQELEDIKSNIDSEYTEISDKILKSMIFEPGWLGMDNAFFYPTGMIVMDSILKKYGLNIQNTEYGDKEEEEETGVKRVKFRLKPYAKEIVDLDGNVLISNESQNIDGELNFDSRILTHKFNQEKHDVVVNFKLTGNKAIGEGTYFTSYNVVANGVVETSGRQQPIIIQKIYK